MAGEWNFETTKEIPPPKDPFDRIIGQEEAVRIARIIARQKRNLLLVGPPGTGKSMIAQAIASVLPRPRQEISILDNEENSERPLIEIRTQDQIHNQEKKSETVGALANPLEVPTFVAEHLGFRCSRCGAFSEVHLTICPSCGADKFIRSVHIRVGDGYGNVEAVRQDPMRISTSRKTVDGREERIIYERTREGYIRMLTQQDMQRLAEINRKSRRKIIVPLERTGFVQASGASETELLGDIKHDPYGGHPKLGTPAYTRVVPGAVHEAHEGVLFLDELTTLGSIQRFILTAMQDRRFPIVGRNPTSSGASVRVDAVPCNFILVGAVNINDVGSLIPALRSRVRGDGYEVLMRNSMENTEENRAKIARFISQEIIRDGKIPHAHHDAVKEILEEARRIARRVDNSNGISLRLRSLAGIIKLAGDTATIEASELIRKEHVQLAIRNALSVEEQLGEKYESWWKAESADYGYKSPKAGPETA